MIVGVFVFLIIISIYGPWFTSFGTLSSGDWPYLFAENIKEFSFFPEARFLWLAPYYQIFTKVLVQYVGIPWEIVERLFWFLPFLILSILSSYYLTKSWIGVLLYTSNTYILMVVGGGQMGIAIAYSITPFVLKSFMNLIDSLFSSAKNFKFQISNFKLPLILGLVLSLLTMFDPRVAYIILIAIVTYSIFGMKYRDNFIHNALYIMLYTFIVPIGIAIIINSYWIIPLFREGVESAIESFDNPLGFKYFSFADFSHAFSLLHPNWPENIFGKTYFMKAEFLILPILAFSSLFFVSSKLQLKTQSLNNNSTIQQFNPVKITSQFNGAGNRTIIFFALLGILGAFLAKGANDPFGEINAWLFQYFPGMNMFRDPTKFYIFVALSYSVLIPFGLEKLVNKGSSIKYHMLRKINKYTYYLILTTFFFFWIFLIHPAVLGQLGGTFKPHEVPQEYIALKNFILNQKYSFNTLWVPRVQRFVFYSKSNQAISADELFEAYSIPEVQRKFQGPEVEREIKNLNIKYIIVPFDSQKELFLNDRNYDPALYNSTVSFLQDIDWVELEYSFGDIRVFRLL